ncbi:HNH endonuclease [Mycobacterium phage Reindeer]|uniref:HNH endonuclease n=1 Tax=Mycobacterium phage Reindeer TaxID=2762283 RepID=A0A7G8LI21_9CAUD|nr:HNH endonuclease [Mycobacterium phage Reindeer]QNJ56893.1 HNH endonuclease [Mycobacterium phage Reindeer]
MSTHWKPVRNTEGLYLASDDGQILRKEYLLEKVQSNGRLYRRVIPEQIVKPYVTHRAPSNNQHPVIRVRRSIKDRNGSERRVAAMVAAAHLGLPYDPDDIADRNQWRLAFRDGDPLNVHVDNLEWVSNQGVNTMATHDDYYRNLQAFRALAETETAESFLARYYSPDEIDWSTAERIAA